MRGDRPLYQYDIETDTAFTPHARGSTSLARFSASPPPVYPACAGIDPRLRFFRPSWAGLPRMRGDRPHHTRGDIARQQFTPHARGSTCTPLRLDDRLPVYPACAGIDLAGDYVPHRLQRLPRMRGDRPCSRISSSSQYSFTPHARGSTVFDP